MGQRWREEAAGLRTDPEGGVEEAGYLIGPHLSGWRMKDAQFLIKPSF